MELGRSITQRVLRNETVSVRETDIGHPMMDTGHFGPAAPKMKTDKCLNWIWYAWSCGQTHPTTIVLFDTDLTESSNALRYILQTGYENAKISAIARGICEDMT